MIVVNCPNCGPRTSSDLRPCGEVNTRPDPAISSQSEWRTYLYLRENPAGWVTEPWYCRSGCRRYFTIERNTATHEIRDSEAS